ncbi:MAG: DUF748 domain-containing protein [Deltaproteobacteria bacterium]|nr:DUF748 domain-containing protein [Deltaproteobacteria bacterium]
MEKGTLNLSHQRAETTHAHSLKDITLDLENISLKPESRGSVRVTAILDERGRISADGTLSIALSKTQESDLTGSKIKFELGMR